jgi:uncharacterized protein YkwD
MGYAGFNAIYNDNGKRAATYTAGFPNDGWFNRALNIGMPRNPSFPFYFNGTDLYGNALTEMSLGDKELYGVFYWSTTCPHNIISLDIMGREINKLGGNIGFLGITGSDAGAARALMERVGITFPSLHSTGNLGGLMAAAEFPGTSFLALFGRDGKRIGIPISGGSSYAIALAIEKALDTETAPPLGAAVNITVTNTDQWNAAVAGIKNNGSKGNYIITINGAVGAAGTPDVRSSCDAKQDTFSFGETPPGSALKVTLRGNGRLYLTSRGNLIGIGKRQTLVIDSPNLTLQGMAAGQNGAAQDNNTSVIRVSRGSLELNNGAVSENASRNGYVANGGGVTVMKNGSFTMNGGTISGNYVKKGGGDASGGVLVKNNGTFTMNGGAVFGNSAESWAGGVFVYYGTFVMNNGTIHGNAATSGIVPGGVGMNNGGLFVMNGGTISGNRGMDESGGIGNRAGTFRMVNGTISGNDAPEAFRNTTAYSWPAGERPEYTAIYGAAMGGRGDDTCGTYRDPLALSGWQSKAVIPRGQHATISVRNGDIAAAPTPAALPSGFQTPPLTQYYRVEKSFQYPGRDFWQIEVYDSNGMTSTFGSYLTGNTFEPVGRTLNRGDAVRVSYDRDNTIISERITSLPSGVTIPQPGQQTLLGLSFSSAKADAERITGRPFCSVTDGNGEWCFYGTYANFTMLHFTGGRLDYIYTNATGSTFPVGPSPLTDGNDGNKTYAYVQGDISGLTINASANEQIIFELTNAFRAFNGKPALTWNGRLADAARKHSKDMHDRIFFEHDTPEGITPQQRATRAGYNQPVGENIIMGFTDGITAADGWINSGGHRENMLGKYTELGVGWFCGTKGYKTYGTQKFATPR